MSNKFRIEGAKELEKRLVEFGPKIHRKVMKQAINAGAEPVVKAAKSALASMPERPGWRRTNLTKKAIGKRVIAYSKTQTTIAVIGPRVGFAGMLTSRGKVSRDKSVLAEARKINRLARARVVKIHDPAKIAHLVEGGHGGPHAAPPHPFLLPALNQTISQIKEAMSQKIAVGIERAAKAAI